MSKPEPIYPAERLAYWYLRFNGYLTTENFVVHPDTGSRQRTDADLLGIRLAHRKELLESPMTDDAVLVCGDRLLDVVIVEVKSGECGLNGPWTAPEDMNVHRVLSAIGILNEGELEQAAHEIYENGRFQNAEATIRLLAFGDGEGTLSPPVQQVFFDQMIEFIHRRFEEYRHQKSSVGNWAADGRELRDMFQRSPDAFRADARRLFGLPVVRNA